MSVGHKLFDFRDEIGRRLQACGPCADPARSLAARHEAIQHAFPGAVAKAGWHRFAPGDVFDPATRPRVIVAGIALWSESDLAALGDLAEALDGKDVSVYVLDIDDRTVDGRFLVDRIPGLAPFTRTPVIAEYLGGKIVHKLQGPGAIQKLFPPSVGPWDNDPTRFGRSL